MREDDRVDPFDAILEDEGQVGGFSPEGVFAGAEAVGPEDPIPEATAENMVCLRGPCRHYVEITKRFKAGNRGMDRQFTQATRFCNALTSEWIELTDEAVFDCNRWEPMSTEELVRIRTAREQFNKTQTKGSHDAGAQDDKSTGA